VVDVVGAEVVGRPVVGAPVVGAEAWVSGGRVGSSVSKPALASVVLDAVSVLEPSPAQAPARRRAVTHSTLPIRTVMLRC
jgi:hypothetical protein